MPKAPLHPESDQPKRWQLPPRLTKLWPTRRRYQILAVAGIVILVAALSVVNPGTRYVVIGKIVRHDTRVRILDSATHRPVTEAVVNVSGHDYQTDAAGEVVIPKLGAGNHSVSVSKKYYNLIRPDIHVYILKANATIEYQIDALGTPVGIKIIDAITAGAVAGAKVTVLNAEYTTNDLGEAFAIVPTARQSETSSVSGDGFNSLSTTVKNSANPADNTIKLVPVGYVTYLSKRTGTINVYKADLDGSNAKVLVAGTGKENDYDTQLMMSPDQKFVMLVAKREGQYSSLYRIDPTTGSIAYVDGKNGGVHIEGWASDRLVYQQFTDKQLWEPAHTILKTYQPATSKIITIAESEGTGNSYNYVNSSFSSIIVFQNQIIYGENYYAPFSGNLRDKVTSLKSVLADGSNEKNLVEMPALDQKDNFTTTAVMASIHNPSSLTLSFSSGDSTYYRYDGKTVTKIKPTDNVSSANFTLSYSPDGQKVMWSEPRDGTYTTFMADANGQNATQLATGSEQWVVSWLNSNYVLLQKDYKLYISSADMKSVPVKIADIHSARFGY